MQLKSPGMAEIPSANEKLTAFLELESAIRACGELSRRVGEFFPDSASLNESEFRRRTYLPARFFAFSGPATAEINVAGIRKEEP